MPNDAEDAARYRAIRASYFTKDHFVIRVGDDHGNNHITWRGAKTEAEYDLAVDYLMGGAEPIVATKVTKQLIDQSENVKSSA